MAGYSRAWAEAVLRAIRAPVTPNNVQLLDAWSRAEGGRAANNPLNTTQAAPGATNMNSAGVKNYPSPAAGVAATVATLTNGRYGTILSNLRANAPATQTARAIAASPWGTGSGVSRVLGDRTPPPSSVGAPLAVNGTATDFSTNPLLNPLGWAEQQAGNAAGNAVSAALAPLWALLLYGTMTLVGLGMLGFGLILLLLSTSAGQTALHDATTAGAAVATDGVSLEAGAAEGATAGGGAAGDGLTAAQRASLAQRDRQHQDRLQLARDRDQARQAQAAQRAADARGRETRARRERTKARQWREEENARQRGATLTRAGLGARPVTFWDPDDDLVPTRAPARRTAGTPLPADEMPPF